MNKLFDKWLRERQLYICLFIILFFFLDLITTYIGMKLGGFEVNPLARPAVQAGSWTSLFLVKLIGTVVLLYGFYYLFKVKAMQKKEVTAIVGGQKYKTYIIDEKKVFCEAFTWGLLLGICGAIIVMNIATILLLLG